MVAATELSIHHSASRELLDNNASAQVDVADDEINEFDAPNHDVTEMFRTIEMASQNAESATQTHSVNAVNHGEGAGAHNASVPNRPNRAPSQIDESLLNVSGREKSGPAPPIETSPRSADLTSQNHAVHDVSIATLTLNASIHENSGESDPMIEIAPQNGELVTENPSVNISVSNGLSRSASIAAESLLNDSASEKSEQSIEFSPRLPTEIHEVRAVSIAAPTSDAFVHENNQGTGTHQVINIASQNTESAAQTVSVNAVNSAERVVIVSIPNGLIRSASPVANHDESLLNTSVHDHSGKIDQLLEALEQNTDLNSPTRAANAVSNASFVQEVSQNAELAEREQEHSLDAPNQSAAATDLEFNNFASRSGFCSHT